MLGSKEKKLLNDIAGLSDRLQTDKLYEFAMNEISDGQFALAAKARALEDAAGDNAKISSFYIKHRVRMLRDQLEAKSISDKQRAIDDQAKEEARQLKHEQLLQEKEREAVILQRKKDLEVAEQVTGNRILYVIIIALFLFIFLSIGATH